MRGVADHEAARAPNTLAGLEAAIQPEYQGQGVSYQIIQAMRSHAVQQRYQQ